MNTPSVGDIVQHPSTGVLAIVDRVKMHNYIVRVGLRGKTQCWPDNVILVARHAAGCVGPHTTSATDEHELACRLFNDPPGECTCILSLPQRRASEAPICWCCNGTGRIAHGGGPCEVCHGAKVTNVPLPPERGGPKRGTDYAPDRTIVEGMARLVLNMCARRRGGIGGQMFTPYDCALCKKESAHHNTAVPLLCKECEDKVRALRTDPTQKRSDRHE